jgi:hypothetical protein
MATKRKAIETCNQKSKEMNFNTGQQQFATHNKASIL